MQYENLNVIFKKAEEDASKFASVIIQRDSEIEQLKDKMDSIYKEMLSVKSDLINELKRNVVLSEN